MSHMRSTEKFVGVITKIASALVNGNTMYSFCLQEVKDPERWSPFTERAVPVPQLRGIFSAYAKVSPHLLLTEVGSLVEVTAETIDDTDVRRVESFAPWKGSVCPD